MQDRDGYQMTNYQPMPTPVQMNGGGRTLRYLRGAAYSSVVLAAVVFMLDKVLPQGYTPSHLLGSFNGNVERAELNAKVDAVEEFERRTADARAAPPAAWNMETQVSQNQQQVVRESLEVHTAASKVADFACYASFIIRAFWGRDPAAVNVADGMATGCALGPQIRQQMAEELAATARNGSALKTRPAADPAPQTLPPGYTPAQRAPQGVTVTIPTPQGPRIVSLD
jgi:hypothetical protein